MALPAKLLLGGIGLGAAGTGFGIEKLAFSGSKNTVSSTRSKSTTESITVKRECRIHKLITSQGEGSFQRIEKDELEREIERDKKGEFQGIKEACDRLGGKDIFVSNKSKTGWKYYQNDQTDNQYKPKFEKYLRGLKLI
ncbi:hypothetical protein MHF_0706 [Mycoplasma haemofelis Ohio2]|uniref:Uncharacterized protein n=1 Tax=Mycoplasma haemofelis (strain Ohio2) TaxID=859194 RepID=F6FIC8_MYCHI|nr:hypothetical protein MHF_0706 [Mycoplasma haemofelis Ohio2]